MENENSENRNENIYSNRVRAGKRRTYFFDVRSTRGNDFYLTITESRKRFDDNGYERHKIFLYKEDFNKFIKALGEAADYVKTELMPDFDFDAFNHENEVNEMGEAINPKVAVDSLAVVETNQEADTEITPAANEVVAEAPTVANSSSDEVVDKW